MIWPHNWSANPAPPPHYRTNLPHKRQQKKNLLTRLVALNAQRALEEAQGHIRWLRPDYQNPQASVGAGLRNTMPKAGGRDGSGERCASPSLWSMGANPMQANQQPIVAL